MTYRDEQIALDERKAALKRELDQAKSALSAQRDMAERSARMERELVEIEARLRGEKRRLPMLENIQIASPCHAEWSEMIGDNRVRYCGSCEKNVFNLSAMTRDEAESLIIASGSKICVRMYKRTDGTVMTEDCTVGAKKKRRKRLAAALVGAAALGAAVSMTFKFKIDRDSQRTNDRARLEQLELTPMTGAMVAAPDPASPPNVALGQMVQGGIGPAPDPAPDAIRTGHRSPRSPSNRTRVPSPRTR